MTPQQQAELALNRATVCDTTDILELIIDQSTLYCTITGQREPPKTCLRFKLQK